jgi:hypothetical protein
MSRKKRASPFEWSVSDVCRHAALPRNWLCIDCDTNTAPGLSTAKEVAAAWSDSGTIKQTIDDRSEVYSVHPEVWKAAGMRDRGGCLCIGCLEERLGRRLRAADFIPDNGLNETPGSRRLQSRRRRKPYRNRKRHTFDLRPVWWPFRIVRP